MAKSAEHPMLTLFHALYSRVPGNYVELRAIPNSSEGGLKPKRIFATTPDDALTFINTFSDRKSDFGVYFGVCKRVREGGKKGDVLGATAIWADVDTLKNGQDTDAVIKLVHALPKNLRPSICIKSGGGLHLYWLLSSLCTDQEQIVKANAAVQALVGGDTVHDVTRILRVPGSWNTKRTKPAMVEIVWCNHWEQFYVSELPTNVEAFGKVIDGGKMATHKALLRDEMKTKPLDIQSRVLAMMGGGDRKMERNLETMWRDQVRYRAPRGYMGIHEAQLISTARLHCAELPDNKIVENVMRWTEEVMTRSDPEAYAHWSKSAEKKTIEDMLLTWKPQYQALKARERAEKRAAAAASKKGKNGVSA